MTTEVHDAATIGEAHPSLRVDRPGLAAAAIIGIVLGAIGMIRYANWWAGAVDLGVFDQGIWLMSRGFAPEVTINGRNLFADHLSPVVVLFVPLYRLAATPYWLFAAQGAALGATVLPLRAFARDVNAPPWVATVAVALGTPLAAAAMFEFHPTTLAVPFVAWTALEAHRGNVARTTIAGALVLCCRAELAWVLVGLAVVAAPIVRKRLIALGLVGVVAGFTIPAALGARGTFTVHFGHLGATPKDALTHPWRILEALASADTLTKLLILFLPVAGLTFLKPRWAAATLLASLPVLLSQWSGTSLPWFHYWAPMYPIAVCGALVALGDPNRHLFVRPQLVVAGGLLAMALMSPLSPAAPDSVGLRALTDHRTDREQAGAQVRPGDAVVGSNRILAHLMHRRKAYLFPAPYGPGDPPELSPKPSKAEAAKIDVIVLDGADVKAAAAFGLTGQAVDGLLVLRPNGQGSASSDAFPRTDQSTPTPSSQVTNLPEDWKVRVTDGAEREETLRLLDEAVVLLGKERSGLFDNGDGFEVRVVMPTSQDAKVIARLQADTSIPLKVVSVPMSDSWLERTAVRLAAELPKSGVSVGVDLKVGTLYVAVDRGIAPELWGPKFTKRVRDLLGPYLSEGRREGAVADGVTTDEAIDIVEGRIG